MMKKTGMMIILRALEEPLRQIAEDVDAEDSVFKSLYLSVRGFFIGEESVGL
ncbi:hypothetical protein [Aedoeadaptatus nemausensis]|uniref:hypothetical protein n=1 Tax=Aedoeadaptatus nemausensis TaxID=2582829 RepID=UPI0015D68FD0|nr:hypothetical protein [Peptoniphilus nemausensis]